MIAHELRAAGNFIAGREEAGAATFSLTDPAHGRRLAEVARSDASETARAVRAAREAFERGTWSRASVHERARVLHRLGDLLEAALPEMAELEALCTGRPIREMRAQLSRLPEFYRYFAALVRTEEGIVPPFEGDYVNIVRRVPLGAVAQLTPWNHPLLILTKKLAPALAAGNAVVVKPSEYTPLTTLELARLAQRAGLPDGNFNVLNGFGAQAGAALCASEGLAKIDLTGGTETGRAVAAAAGAKLIRVSCELGGKAPVIVLDDADLDLAAAGAAFAAFIAAGQTCVAGARILVHRRRHDAFVRKLIERAVRIRLGDPLDPATQMGPLVSARQLARVEEYVALGVAEGARAACGGRRPAGAAFANGHYYEPTVLTGVESRMRVAQEEIFGPVTCVIPYDDDDDAIRLGNDTAFGLAASVWSPDATRALRISRELRCGIVWINDHHRIDPSSPWGGFKSSGIGRENGRETLHEYSATQSVVLNTAATATDWYATDDVLRLS